MDENKQFPIITAENLTPASDLKVPEATTPAVDSTAITKSRADILDQAIKDLPQPTIEETAVKGTQSDLLKLMEDVTGEATRTSELETQKGVPAQKQRLQELTNQMRSLNAEAEAEQLKAEKMGETLGFVRGEQGEIERQRAIRALTISASAQAIQGNLALAQSEIENALKVEFEPKELKLKYLAQTYEFNKDALTRMDKKRADELSRLITERDKTIQEEKDLRKSILNVSMEATKGGADNLTIQAIQNTKTLEEAQRLAAPALAKAEWSAPYLLGGDYVQKNLKTGEIRTAVNMSAGGRTDKSTMLSNASVAFESVKGTDGFINPNDWKKLRSTWLQQGGLLKDFEDNFSIYQNPKDTY